MLRCKKIIHDFNTKMLKFAMCCYNMLLVVYSIKYWISTHAYMRGPSGKICKLNELIGWLQTIV
jgi:hypothetical protein